jgi:hypothetical protein
MPFSSRSRSDRDRAAAGADHRSHSSSGQDAPGDTSASVALAELLPAFAQLVDDTIAQVLACPAKPDPTFEGFGDLLAVIRSATTLEGALLEKGIALVAACHPDLDRIHLDRPLPVHDAAKAIFRRNDWARASSLRLDSQTITREFYRPDLLLIDGARQLGLMLDIKRSVASLKPRALVDLRARMMASALVTRDMLEREYDAPPIARVEIAIIDCSGERRDETRGILTLTDLDWLLGIEGAAAALAHLRRTYGGEVRRLLDERCRAIVGPQRLIAPGGGVRPPSSRRSRGEEADDAFGGGGKSTRADGQAYARRDEGASVDDVFDADADRDTDADVDTEDDPQRAAAEEDGPGDGDHLRTRSPGMAGSALYVARTSRTVRSNAPRCSVGLAAQRSRA